jgi:hypothetical protein
MAQFWFKAEIKFLCPSCKQESIESIVASDTRHNPDAVAVTIRERVKPVVCQRCKAICPDGVQIFLGMNDLTPEELAKVKFIPPPSGSKV